MWISLCEVGEVRVANVGSGAGVDSGFFTYSLESGRRRKGFGGGSSEDYLEWMAVFNDRGGR